MQVEECSFLYFCEFFKMITSEVLSNSVILNYLFPKYEEHFATVTWGSIPGRVRGFNSKLRAGCMSLALVNDPAPRQVLD